MSIKLELIGSGIITIITGENNKSITKDWGGTRWEFVNGFGNRTNTTELNFRSKISKS